MHCEVNIKSEESEFSPIIESVICRKCEIATNSHQFQICYKLRLNSLATPHSHALTLPPLLLLLLLRICHILSRFRIASPFPFPTPLSLLA